MTNPNAVRKMDLAGVECKISGNPEGFGIDEWSTTQGGDGSIRAFYGGGWSALEFAFTADGEAWVRNFFEANRDMDLPAGQFVAGLPGDRWVPVTPGMHIVIDAGAQMFAGTVVCWIRDGVLVPKWYNAGESIPDQDPGD